MLGTYEETVYGLQLVANSVFRVLPQGEQIVSLVEYHPFFTGIGRLAISEIWRRTNTRLFLILDSYDSEALIAHGLTRRQSETLIRGWAQYCEQVWIEGWAIRNNLSFQTVQRAYEMWGRALESRVESDPYCLTPFDTWGPVDRMARDVFGVKPKSKRRRLAACVKVLNDAAALGFLRVKREDVERRVSRLLDDNAEAALAIRETVKGKSVQYCMPVRNSLIQGLGAAMLEKSFVQVVNSRRHLVGTFDKDILLTELGTAPELQILACEDAEGITALRPVADGRHILHLCGSDSISRRVRVPESSARSSVQEVLASGIEALGSFHVAVVYDASLLSFTVLHALLRRLSSVDRIVLILYAPFAVDSHLQDNVSLKFLGTSAIQSASTRKTTVKWTETTLDLCSPETLRRALNGESHIVRLYLQASHHQEGYDIACRQFRMCSSVGETLFMTMTRGAANEINRQFHNENIDARQYQSLPCELAALSRQQFATNGDFVIWNGNNFRRRLLRGARGQVREVFKRGRVEFDDEGGVHELAMVVCFDCVGEVQIRKSELSLLRLGYSSSYNEPIQPRVEFVILLLADRRFLAVSAVTLATSCSASATIVVGTNQLLKSAGCLGKWKSEVEDGTYRSRPA
ncbi:hypothetical protein [Caballeronia sp. SBC1]|uniref:hypothetical protein n=1 Tax=Caballeronia sp. SBC1 TaxID=2705548 RepID=UPI00140DD467|nr:hypothetical protein [Caballeronia sp. SBC1]